MTHKSIDALLASTMFLLFTLVTPHYEDIAKKIVFIDNAVASTYYSVVSTLPSTGSVSTASASTTTASSTAVTTSVSTAGTTSSTSFNFMTTLSATTPVSHPVSSGSTNVELAQFLVINSGPDMKIDSMALKIIGTAGLSSISNVSLYDTNDVQIGTTGATVSADGVTFYFTNLSAVAKSGVGFRLKVKADISSKFTSADNGKTIGIAFAKGSATNTTFGLSADMGSAVNGNLMTLITATTVKPNVTLSSTTPASQTVISGSRYVPIAHFNINNPTGSDINIGSFVLWEKGNAGNIQGLELYDSNNTQLSEHLTGQDGVGGFYFSKVSFVVKANSTFKIVVKADVLATAVSGSKVGVAFGKGGGYKLVDNSAVELGTDTDISANLMTVTTSSVNTSCTNWEVAAGGPQGGTYWEKLRDFSQQPQIEEYRIQWFNGNWSPWYLPGVHKDTKVNNDGSWRYMIAYLQDHNWQTRKCVNGQTQNGTVTVLSPNGGESYTVTPDKVTYKTWLDYKINILPQKNGTLSKSVVQNPDINNIGANHWFGDSNYISSASSIQDSGGIFGDTNLPSGKYYLMAEWKSDDGKEHFADFSDKSFTITNPTSSPSCGKTVSKTNDLPYNSPGVSFQFFPDSSIDTAEIGTKDVSIGDGFFVNGKGCLTELSLDFYSGWEGSVLDGTVYLINKDGAILSKATLNNYSQATFKDINFELDGQDTLFVAVDLADNFKPQNIIHTLNQQVTIMGYKYIRSEHDTIYNIKDGVNRLGTAIVYDQTEPQTIPVEHLYIKNTTNMKAITAYSKRNTKIATFDMQGYLGARPGNITFQIGSDTSTPNLKNSIYFINTKTGDRAKVSNVGSVYTFDFGEVRHNWDTMQTYALYVNKPKVASSKAKTYPISYLGVQEANNMDNYGSDVMFLKLTLKK